MPPVRSADFDVAALHDALDRARRARGMSWQQLAREINAPFARLPSRPISPTTLSGMAGRGAIEGDGVLQMLRWLGRTPESFVPERDEVAPAPAALPDVGPHQILRFDTRRIHALLDAQRAARSMTWAAVAREIGGVTAAGLNRFRDGGRTGFPPVARIAEWLQVPVASLTRGFDW